MAGGSITPQQSSGTSFDPTGYANQRGPDPFTGYAPPPVQMDPFRPSAATGSIFRRTAAQKQQLQREQDAYNQQRVNAEAAQQAQIAASRQQVERSLNPIFGGYRSARQAPQQFRGQFSSPFSYTQPQPSYFEPQMFNPFAMQPMPPQPAPAQQPSMMRPINHAYIDPNQPVAPPTPVTIGGQSPIQIGAGSGFGGLAGLLGRFR